jgi:branched-chain amino acid transport system permease protein
MRFWAVRLLSVLVAVGGAVAFDMIARSAFSGFTQRLVVLGALYVTLAVSLNLINGITGQFSMGHAAFYQVGAYTTMYLANRFHAPAGMAPALWLVLMMGAGAAAAAVAGLLVGLPSLRLRGDYLAIVTLGFGEIVRIVVQNQKILGESAGKSIEPGPLQYIWIAVLLAVGTTAVCRNLLKTAHGLPFLAVREDEVAALAMGVDVTRTKVTAFVLGSAFAGAAGAILAHYEAFILPSMFTMDVSFIIVTMVVLGGTGSITGSVIAALFLFYLPEKMRDLGDIRMASIVGVAIALVAAVVLLRREAANFHGSLPARIGRNAAIIVGAVVLSVVLGAALGGVKGLQTMVEGQKLRLVVFAVTLVVLMLLRPQGIFGHREFGWGSLFGRKQRAVSA